MEDATRVEHMFRAIGGIAQTLPGLRRHRSALNDAGSILALLPSGIDAEDRADRLAAIMLRRAIGRLSPIEILALLTRAFRGREAEYRPCTAASVARWLPGGE
jgi:hypothetical protein